LTKPLPLDDFRAVRIVLEPDDYALGPRKPDLPTDLIDEETWRHIMILPDEVSVRTSDHHGKLLRELNELDSRWVEYAVGDDEDLLHEVLIYMMDEFDAILYNALHGYYRQAIGCLRNVLELVTYGTLWQITNNVTEFKQWNEVQKEMRFGESCDKLSRIDRVQGLEAHLHVTLNDSLFDQKNKTSDGGWARRLYSELCQYSHSRPNYTNAGLWNSNGPLYVARSFKITYSLYYDITALSYLLIKLARPDFTLPEEITKLFRSYRRSSDKVPYESYKFLFGRRGMRQKQKIAS